jgi:hypothetical protein
MNANQGDSRVWRRLAPRGSDILARPLGPYPATEFDVVVQGLPDDHLWACAEDHLWTRQMIIYGKTRGKSPSPLLFF